MKNVLRDLRPFSLVERHCFLLQQLFDKLAQLFCHSALRHSADGIQIEHFDDPLVKSLL